jgi:hypothetical protein
MNISAEDRRIYKGTHIGELSSVCAVNAEKEPREHADLEEKLADLIIRSSTDLTEDRVWKMMTVWLHSSQVIAASNSDFGTTKIVARKIDIGGAHPIKKPLRIISFIAAEINTQVELMPKEEIIEPSSSPWAVEVYNTSFKSDGGKCSHSETELVHEYSENGDAQSDNAQSMRKRHAPPWHKDYVQY